MTEVNTSNADMTSPKDKDDGPPTKKMKQSDLRQFKQARLPFMPLDQKQQFMPGSTPPGSKKRKLSDGESPSAKPPKTQKAVVVEKPSIVENDPEVSSSSETENLPIQNLKSRVRNTLERFVRKNSHEEITSTKEDVTSTGTLECIDLTDSNDGVSEKQIDDTEVVKQTPTCEEEVINEVSETQEKFKKDVTDCHEKNSESVPSKTDKEDTEASSTFMEIDEHSDNKDADNSADDMADDRKRNISETSSVDGEFLTPTKSKMSDSVVKTPKSESETPGSSWSPGNSCSDSTPKSTTKKPRRVSDAKMKEREAMRQKIKEQKELEREKKRKQKEEERLAKEAEREKQRLEREAVKAEKERQKKDAQEKREKERIEKLQLKEEERKKKQELLDAKAEDKRKKEEEKKMKEEEKRKEEEEKKLKELKKKETFTNFFIKPKTSPTSKATKTPSGLFMPFELKKDMKLAPEKRRENLDEESINHLDFMLSNQDNDVLYLQQLQKKEIKPRKTVKKVREDEDVILVPNSNTVGRKCRFKLLQFHMNYRPPYYGTWSKTSKVLTPRNPFRTDSDLFDYEVDSDDEWEEEEPGESLSASEGEEEKEDNSDDEEEDGWMVPHGYLSEDEGCEEDEEVTPEMLKARQKAKADQWESELKRQTKPVLPVIIGCFWEHAVHNIQKELEENLKIYQGVSLMGDQIPTTFNGQKTKKGNNSSGDTEEASKPNSQCKPVPEEAMPDLIRLVHGNLAGMKKLIKEFRMFWKIKTGKEELENPADVSMEDEEELISKSESSMVTESKEEVDMTAQKSPPKVIEDNFAISKRQIEKKINAIAVREKRDPFKKICWYVHEPIQKQYEMGELPVPSTWEFVSQPAKTPNKPKLEETPNSGRKTPTVSITQFARPMSPTSRQAQFAAANAAALAEKQRLAEEQAKLSAENAAKAAVSASEAMDVTPSSQQRSDQKSIKDFAKNVLTPRHHEWKITPAGDSPKAGKRLVLVSSPSPKQPKIACSPKPQTLMASPKTVGENKPKLQSPKAIGDHTNPVQSLGFQNSPSSSLKSPLQARTDGFMSKSGGVIGSPSSLGAKPLQSPCGKRRVIPIPVVDGKPQPLLIPKAIKPDSAIVSSSGNITGSLCPNVKSGENSQDAIVLD